MKKKFICLVGLPGSGKTHYGKQLGYPFLDDLTQCGGLGALFFLDSPAQFVLISDFSFIFEDTRNITARTLRENYPDCEIKWVVWENNPDLCWENVQRRNDGRKINKQSLFEISKAYTYPEGVTLRRVFNGNANETE